MKLKCSPILVFILATTWSLNTWAVVPPRPSPELDYLEILVNGQRRIIRSGDELTVVAGDKLLLKAASLRSGKSKVATINVIGFANTSETTPQEDRGYVIDTASALLPQFAVKSRGPNVYEVRAHSGRTLHGRVYIRVLSPILNFAVLSINGESRVLRPNETATVRAADQVKVERVETNVEAKDEVVFKIAPTSRASAGPSAPNYEIRFSRGGLIFARIPLRVEG